MKRIYLQMIMFALVALSATASGYRPVANHRKDLNLDSGWRFIRQDVADAQTLSFDDSSWERLNLPHTWNNFDGEEGNTNYYRGVGWYRKHISIERSYKKRQWFLKFDGAFLVTDVY